MPQLFLLCLVLSTLPVWPVDATELTPAGQAVVREIIDGDTLTLDNGESVRLAGIQAPKLPLNRPHFAAWPLAEEAQAALSALTKGQSVRFSYGGARTDRYRRLLAHLHRMGDGLWIQGEMLKRGLARVYTFSDNRALAAEMLALEGAARAAKRGIWAEKFYAVRQAGELDPFIDTFQLVEGIILNAARIRDYIYLNFGPDFRTDFTVSIHKRNWRQFEASGVDPINWAGKAIRVRGWLDKRNGPMIEITHPEQAELLNE
jgi:endonuclease YncB( thermonuclease family)